MGQTQHHSLTPSPYGALRPRIVSLVSNGEHRQALALLRELYTTLPPSAELMDDMATCYWNLGDAPTALKLCELAAQTAPGAKAIWGKLGAMALSAGDTAAAAKAFRQVLRLDPRNANALAALNRVTPLPRSGRQAAILRQIAKSPKAPATDRAVASNTLGLMEQAAGNGRAAFYHFAQSKAQGPGIFDAAAAQSFVADQRARFRDPAHPVPDPAPAPRLIFVVGMPRSGTTLVESILTRHPMVSSLGESSTLKNCLRLCRQQTAQPQGWDWVDALNPADIPALRAAYLKRSAQRIVGPFAPVLLDKTPLNLFDVGFARHLFPEARFVFLSRHPLDVGLSNFSTHYAAPHAFSKTLKDIGKMTRALFASAEDYRSKLGAAFHWQSYAALVSTPEPQIRALLAACDLPWDDRCLAPQDRTGAVKTASFLQVRSKINTDGLGKWRPFEAELEPLIKALGGWTWIEEWATLDATRAEAASVA